MLSIKTMLEMKEFSDFRLIAGAGGLEREIKLVSVMDAPDIHRWMRGGELLITSGYVMLELDIPISELIRKLYKSGVCALAVKVQRYLHHFDDETIQLANELQFPLLDIPQSFPFVDIINPILANIINEQNKVLSFSEKTHNQFTDLVIAGKGPEEILLVLQEIINEPVVLFDEISGSLLAVGDCQRLEDDLKRHLSSPELYKKIHDKFFLYPLKFGKVTFSNLVLYKKPKDWQIMVAVAHAATVLILAQQRLSAKEKVEEKYCDEFIYDLISNNILSREEGLHRAKSFDINFERGGFVIVIDADSLKMHYVTSSQNTEPVEPDVQMEKILSIVKSNLHYYPGNILHSKKSDHIISIVPIQAELSDKTDLLKTLLCKIVEQVQMKTNSTVTISVGSWRHNVQDMHESYHEAKEYLTICKNLNKNNQVHFVGQVSLYTLLSLIASNSEAKEFCFSCLSGVLCKKKSGEDYYIPTLICLMECNWNLKEAARQLYIHYNTMKYRYQKLSQLLDVDFANHSDRFRIELALKVYTSIYDSSAALPPSPPSTAKK